MKTLRLIPDKLPGQQRDVIKVIALERNLVEVMLCRLLSSAAGGLNQVRSTNIKRTQLSAASLLNGLYPEHKRAGGAPIPIEVRDPDSESMYPLASCLRHKELLWTKRLSMEFEGSDRVWHGLPPVYVQRALSEVLGTSATEYIHWPTVKEVFTCHELHGLELPRELEGLTWGIDHAMEYAGWEWAAMYDDFEMCRLAVGRFAAELLDDIGTRQIQSCSGQPAGPAVKIYSGHDSTITPLLAALGQNDGVWPAYASTLYIERAVSSLNGSQYVRILFNDNVLYFPKSVDGWLPLAEFDSLLTPFVFDSDEDYHAASKPQGQIEVPQSR